MATKAAPVVQITIHDHEERRRESVGGGGGPGHRHAMEKKRRFARRFTVVGFISSMIRDCENLQKPCMGIRTIWSLL